MIKTSILIFLSILPKFLSQPCLVTTFDQVLNATRNCADIVIENLTVPGGVTLKLNLTDGATVTFKGTTTFEYSPWRGPLVTINGTGVIIQGDEGHIFDGQGQQYWDGLGDWGLPKPNFFTIQTFGGSIVRNISVINSPHDLVQITNSDNAIYTNWYFNNTAGDPGISPKGKEGRNTDAFDVWNSTNILISDSIVYNQDDCVALRCGENITVRNLVCHGSHGLSISVGFSNDSAPINTLNTLRNVHISDSSLFDGENGIHIKTHNEGGFGLIENVTYDELTFSGNTRYGIIIEENYPNHGEPSNNVPIKNLTIRNIFGHVRPDATAVYVLCAEGGCENWNWKNNFIQGSHKKNSCNFRFPGSSICDNNSS